MGFCIANSVPLWSQTLLCEISGSNGGEYEYDCLLVCCAVYCHLMMEAVNASETSVTSTRHHVTTFQKNRTEHSCLNSSFLQKTEENLIWIK
jgi:hypothetical protein